MAAVKVDDRKRIRLPVLKAGDYYELELMTREFIALRRIRGAAGGTPMTAAQVRRTIRKSRLDFGAGYDEVRALTREP